MAVGDALVRRSCASWLGIACVAVTVSSCVKARLMRILVMRERIPCLVLIIPACRRLSASSRQLYFKTAHIFIILGLQTPSW